MVWPFVKMDSFTMDMATDAMEELSWSRQMSD